MNKLMIRLWGIIEGESSDSINYQIAKTLISNISTMKHSSSSELAKLCHVSKPSISRFCKLVGYDDFYDFRAEINEFFPDRGAKYLLKKHGDGGWINQYLEEVSDNMRNFQDPNFQKKLLELIDDIVCFPQINLMGNMQSGKTAANVYSNLNHFKKNINAYVGLTDQKEAFDNLQSRALYIVFSVSGEYFRALFSNDGIPNRKDSAKVWLITTNPLVNRLDGVDCILNCKTGSDLASSNISLEIIGNLIALGYWNKMQEK